MTKIHEDMVALRSKVAEAEANFNTELARLSEKLAKVSVGVERDFNGEADQSQLLNSYSELYECVDEMVSELERMAELVWSAKKEVDDQREVCRLQEFARRKLMRQPLAKTTYVHTPLVCTNNLVVRKSNRIIKQQSLDLPSVTAVALKPPKLKKQMSIHTDTLTPPPLKSKSSNFYT